MSYLVLARKWRPQKFEDVVGQEHITTTLARAIERDRIAHAYLFTGPRGIGKTTTARIMAKCLNCLTYDKPTPEPCNECASCKEITDGRSPDVLEIDGASHRGIDDARELQTNIQYAATGRYKVIIIDEVHMLTKEAFNALLKTLEEPPSNVIFVFATTEPDKVPLTIISRCQRFDFRRVSHKSISAHIKKITQAEGFEIDEEAADFIAIRADGAVRDSLSMLDQIFASEPEKITVETVMKLLGAVPVQSFQKIAQSIGSKDPSVSLQELSNLLESGIDPTQIGKGLVEHFRNAVVAKSHAMNEDYPNFELYDNIAEKHKLQDLLRILKILTDMYVRMKRSDTPRYILEEALIYLALIDEVYNISDLIKCVQQSGTAVTSSGGESEAGPSISQELAKDDGSEQFLTSPQTQSQSAKAGISIPEVTIDAQELPQEPDERFLAVLKTMHKAMAGLLKHTDITLDDKRVLIKFPSSMENVREELLVNSEQFKLLKETTWKAFGADFEVDLIQDKKQKKPPQQKKSDIPASVGKILDMFDAKLEG